MEKTIRFFLLCLFALTCSTMNAQSQPKVMQRVLRFKVTPANEGAIVKIKPEDSTDDYQLWGTVNAQGCIERLLDTGAYLYEVTADKYKTVQGRICLDKAPSKYVENVTLTPNFGYLQIEDVHGIAGADVYINNKKVGKVPYKSDRLDCADNYQLMISNGELYKRYNATFAIRPNETTRLMPTLVANYAETTICVDGDTEIWVDGKKIGKGTWNGKMAAGVHDVACKLLNHVSTTKQITVENGHALFVVMDKPKPIVGSLNVRTHPSGAQVYIDGKKTEYVTPCMIDNVLIGTHKVELKIDGVKSVEQKVTVKQNMSLTIEKTLCSKNKFAIASKDYMVNDGDKSGINIDELKDNKRIGGTVTTSKEPEVFDNAHVEVPASFPGGERALLQFVSNNLVYPEIAQKQEVEGTVVVRFMVGTNGLVSDLVVENSLSPECDQAVIDVVSKLPRFIPAKLNGRPVSVWFRLPVRFRFANDSNSNTKGS